MVVSSRGLATASRAASAARVSPLPKPMPMRAAPWPDMIAFTSAKSRLIRPGKTIRSLMPCTPWRSTSSASLNASVMGVRLSTTCMSRSLGMVIRVSTRPCRLAMPSSAARWRLSPSNLKGLVTTPIVSAPCSRAISATVGAAPVPVPPPMPAVTKTMSQSASSLVSSSRVSSAASAPRSGSPPAPNPRVSLEPMRTFLCALLSCNAWWSVLTAMNSTPLRRLWIMRLTALLPPPPTPTTLMRAFPSSVRSRSFMGVSSRFLLFGRSEDSPARATSSSVPRSTGPGGVSPSSCPYSFIRSEKFTQPPSQSRPDVLAVAVLCLAGERHVATQATARAPAQQTDDGGVVRPADLVVHAVHAVRRRDPRGQVCHLLDDLRETAQQRASAGEHDPAREAARRPCLLHLLGDQLGHLSRPRPDDLGQEALGDVDRLVVPHRRQLHLRVGGQGQLQAVTVGALGGLGSLQVTTQAHGEVAADVVASDRDHRGVDDAALGEHGHVGGAAADVDHHDAAVEFVLADHRLGGGEDLQDQVVNIEARLVDNLDHVLDGGVGAGDDVGVDLEARAGHAERVADALLSVDRELLGEDVEDLAVRRNADGARRLHGTGDIGVAHLAVPSRHGHHTTRVLRGDAGAGQADDCGVDGHAAHLFGQVDRFRDGLGGPVDLDDRPLADAPGDGAAHADDTEPGAVQLSDGAADLRRS